VSFLLVTIPVSLLLAGSLLWLVVRAVRSGDFDDLDAPAWRHALDDDAAPELDPAPGRDAPGSRSQEAERS
jgi:cbb3-type cytochrome oxidase maturation protein